MCLLRLKRSENEREHKEHSKDRFPVADVSLDDLVFPVTRGLGSLVGREGAFRLDTDPG